MVVAGFFTVNAVLAVILLKMVGLWGKNLISGPALTAVFASKVHSKYRRTGASFSKAQQEFSQEVMTNRTVQTVATDAASSAAQGVFGRSRGN